MKVSDFITELGGVLQEDFTYAPLWTRSQLLGYVRQMLRDFATRTLIADRRRMCLVDGTTGEFTAPENFHSAYYMQFNRAMVDIVQYSDLEFASQTWSLGTTATTPLAATVFGSGYNATVRMVPVPSTVTGAYASGVVSTVTLADSGGTVWTVTCTGGRLVTTVGGAAGLSIVLRAPTTQWTLGVDTLGRLTTTVTVGTSSTVYLTDSSTSETFDVLANDSGEVVTKSLSYGITTRLLLGSTSQTLTTGANSTNANYGALVDLYATGVSATPEHVARLTGPVGDVMVFRSSDYAADMWYKGTLEDVLTVESEIYLSTPFLAVLKHGVLAMALSHDGDGRDLIKAKVLRSLYESECEAIKRMFNRQ